MEGRAAARPDRVAHIYMALLLVPSMEGRAAARPDTDVSHAPGRSNPSLQWRAGQLPGLTRAAGVPLRRGGVPSMEGRAAARPDEAGVQRCRPGGPPSMEGRAAARPDRPRTPRRGREHPPSMEGRAAARPDPISMRTSHTEQTSLQWRAGQLPGLTTVCSCGSRWLRPFNGGPGSCPA